MYNNLDTLKKIIMLGRPQILVGNFLLFFMGAMLAILFNAEFVLSKFILGYSILFTAHLAVHYSNDYFDVKVDKYSESNAISGGGRGILVKNPELMGLSKTLAVILSTLSLAIAAIFTIIFTYPLSFFLFFLFGNLLAWFYTAPPIKLVYRRLGEIANIIAVVIFLGAGFFTLMGTLTIPFFIFAIPIIFLQIIFINSFEIPDMEGDKLGGKITWIVSWGREFGFKLILLSGLLATISFLIIPFTHLYPSSLNFSVLVIISLISLSLGIIELIIKPFDKVSATKFATINVASLFIISILIDGYFIYILR
ncbi:MAG: prenyltransferase [Methanobacterium sp.]|jgi:1,4-dihydroxy-2-naphthoate octaprenyltransferase